MNYEIIDTGAPESMQPLTCNRNLLDIWTAGVTLRELVEKRLSALSKKQNGMIFKIKGSLWPSLKLLQEIKGSKKECVVVSESGDVFAWLSESGEVPSGAEEINVDTESILLEHPWDILAVNEEIVGRFDRNDIEGKIMHSVTVDGVIKLGRNSVILPGVYIEGNVTIGENCKIGPNCYIRGKTAIADGCHVGQAVEIKNCVLMEKVSAGHLSYLGDSVICPKTNLGAGTITANFRHDGKNHRSAGIDGTLLDTGRRKFGTIMGDNVHTGIHTSIYPGRKIWPDMSTRPGDIVQKDLK
jgi:NDP-sugar pyrophosphorylase family protein